MLLVALATQGCGGSSGPTRPVNVAVATVDVAPSPLSVTVAQTAQLTATTKSAAGATLTGRQIQWSASDQTIASVSTTGVVTGVKAGTSVVTATSEGVHKDVSVTVVAATVAVASIDVTPSPLSVILGQTAQLTGTPKSAAGTALSGRQIQWSTADQTIASVSTTGLVTGVKSGSTVVTATSEGVHTDVVVTVAPGAVASVVFGAQPTNALAGTSIAPAIQVRLIDSFGNLIPSTATVTLTLTGGAAGASLAGQATVDAVDGVATFSNLSIARKGTGYLLVASAGGVQSTSSAFNIAAAAPAAIAKLTGDAQTAVAGSTLPTAPSVKVTDAFGNIVDGTTVTFAPTLGSGSVAAGTAQSSADGIATVGSWTVGTVMGPNTLTATAGSVSATFAATVTGAATPGIYMVVGALGSAGTASVAVGQDIAIPLTLDLTNHGSADLASVQLTLNWDPTRLTFKSETVGNWLDAQHAPGSVTINTADAPSGLIRIAGFSASETLSSFVMRNFVLTAAPGSAGASVNVTATVTVAGNAAGAAVPLTVRPLIVTVTP